MFSPANPKSGESVTFDASESTVELGNIETYRWRFGSESPVEKYGETVTHSFSENTIHQVELVVESDRGYRESTVNEVLVGSKVATGCNDAGVRVNGYDWVDGETIQVYMWANMREFPEGTLWKWALDLNTPNGSDSITWLTEKKSDDNYSTDMTKTVTQNDLTVDITELNSIGFHMFDCTRFVSSRDVERDVPSDLTAQIETSSGNADVGDTITFDASNSDGDVEAFNWDFDDGTTATGKRVGHTFESSGEYVVSLTADGANESDTATASVVVVKQNDVDFSYHPANPTEGDDITFEASGGTTYEWNFDDGTVATGERTSHSFPTGGDYEVSVTADDTTHSKTVSVGSSNLRITNIERSAGGVPLKGVSYEETVTAHVDTGADVNRVDFQLENSTESVTDSSGEWSATFDLGELSGTAVLRVTAIDTNGQQVTEERTLSVRSIPDWVDWILDQGQVTVDEENSRIDVTYAPFDLDAYSFDLGDIPISVQPPQFDGAPQAGAGYDASQEAAIVKGDGAIDTDLFGYGFDAALDVEGNIDRELDLVGASGTASVSVAAQVGPPLYVDLPDGVPCLDDRVGIETTVEPGLTLDGNFDGEFQFQSGTVYPSTAFVVSAQLALCGAGAGAQVSGELSAAFDVGTNDPNLSGTVAGSGEVWFNVSAFTVTVSVNFEKTVGSQTQWMQVSAAQSDVEWTLDDKRGSQPASSLDSVDEMSKRSSEHGFLQPEDATQENYARLTDRPIEDTQPSIATTDTQTTVVWSRQQEDKTVTDGRDIAYRVKENDSWSGIQYLTDDQVPQEAPAIGATNTGTLLAVWERVDTAITDDTAPVDIHPHVEIAYATYDGTSWSTPTVLTDSSSREFEPAVAPDGDGWLLAWTADADPTTAERDVRYVRIASDGTAGTINRRTGASYPAVGSYPDTGAVMGYANHTEGDTDEVVWTNVVDGSVTEETTFTASNVTSVTVGNDRVVWQEGSTDDPVLRDGDAESGTLVDLSFDDDVVALAEPSLATDGQDAVLAYRAYVGNTDSRKLVYRLDRGSGWIYDRQFVESPAGDQTVWQPTAALTATNREFETVFAMAERIKSGKNDLFVSTHDFRPDYGVTTSGPTGATAGDTVTIDYTVTNRGDSDATTEETLTVENETGEVATETLGPLAAGDTAGGTVDVTVGPSGDFEFSVGESETVETVATPNLAVADVRASASDMVQVTIENDGGARAQSVPVRVSDGDRELFTRVVDQVKVGETETLVATVDPASLDRSKEDRVVIDPDRKFDDAVTDSARVTPTWLLQPNLVITDEITYREIGGVTVADVLVGNESPVDVETTLQAVRVSDGTVVGETTVEISGSQGGTSYETVRVRFDQGAVNAEDNLEYTVESSVPDQNKNTTVVSDSVGPVFEVTLDSLVERWRKETSGRFQYSTPATDSDHVYVGGLGPEFYALRRSQQPGEVAWSFTREGSLSDSSPCVAEGKVFVGSGGGVLYAFDPSSTDQRTAWTYGTDSAITATPVVHDGTVYFGANDGTVHSVSTGGTPAWGEPASVDGRVHTAADAANGRVFVTTAGGKVAALDSDTGETLWSEDTGDELGSSGPTVADTTLYVAGSSVYAFDVADGSMIWNEPFQYGGTVGSTPAVSGGLLYVGSADKFLYAIDTVDGSERWSYETDAAIASTPTVANERIAVASVSGTVYLLDDTGSEVSTKALDSRVRSSPVIRGSNAFVGTESGKVLSFDLTGDPG